MFDGLITCHLKDFAAPDSGTERTPYACSFHFFPAPGGRTVGMDVIRSDDTGKLGLRVFVAGPDGSLRALIHEAPCSEWRPFATGERPLLGGGGNVLGRGTNWIAGEVHGAGPTLRSVAFSLQLSVVSPGEGVGPTMLDLLQLTATDYLKVRTTGRIVLDGESLDIDGVGPVSVHYGRQLPEYAYLVNVPPTDDPSNPGILVSSIRGDDLRLGEQLLGDLAVTYAHGYGGVPNESLRVGPFGPDLCLGEGRSIVLSQVVSCPHQLLGVPAQTATATATLSYLDPGPLPSEWSRKKEVPLGQVILDVRGDYYTRSVNGS